MIVTRYYEAIKRTLNQCLELNLSIQLVYTLNIVVYIEWFFFFIQRFVFDLSETIASVKTLKKQFQNEINHWHCNNEGICSLEWLNPSSRDYTSDKNCIQCMTRPFSNTPIICVCKCHSISLHFFFLKPFEKLIILTKQSALQTIKTIIYPANI